MRRLEDRHAVEIQGEIAQTAGAQEAAEDGQRPVQIHQVQKRCRDQEIEGLIRLEVERTYHPPVVYYDPFLSPYYPWFYPHAHFYPGPFPEYRIIPGGIEYTLKTLAIKYDATTGEEK